MGAGDLSELKKAFGRHSSGKILVICRKQLQGGTEVEKSFVNSPGYRFWDLPLRCLFI